MIWTCIWNIQWRWSLYVRILCGLLSCDSSPICKKCWSFRCIPLHSWWRFAIPNGIWDFFYSSLKCFLCVIIAITFICVTPNVDQCIIHYSLCVHVCYYVDKSSIDVHNSPWHWGCFHKTFLHDIVQNSVYSIFPFVLVMFSALALFALSGPTHVSSSPQIGFIPTPL